MDIVDISIFVLFYSNKFWDHESALFNINEVGVLVVCMFKFMSFCSSKYMQNGWNRHGIMYM